MSFWPWLATSLLYGLALLMTCLYLSARIRQETMIYRGIRFTKAFTIESVRADLLDIAACLEKMKPGLRAGAFDGTMAASIVAHCTR